jgi:hypothetical protein
MSPDPCSKETLIDDDDDACAAPTAAHDRGADRAAAVTGHQPMSVKRILDRVAGCGACGLVSEDA